MNEKRVFTTVGIFAVVVSGALLVSGLTHDYRPSIPQLESPQTAVPVPFATLVQSTQSKIATRTNYLITSEEQLQSLWQMIAATGTPPVVDFGTHDVLAVFAGDPSSAAIQVSKVQDTNVRDVLGTIVLPGKRCDIARSEHTMPYELVSIPKSGLPLTHQDAVATSTCAS